MSVSNSQQNVDRLPTNRATVVPLPKDFGGVQPGGGFCYRLELLWARWRRRFLKRFRPAYVDRMLRLRRGDPSGAPHEIIDPRDLKYCRNLCECYWLPEDDPFVWRERLPFARWGWIELNVFGWPLLASTIALGWLFPWAAILPSALLALVIYFFRDPQRRAPEEPGLVVAPADGRVVEIERIEYEPFIGGPAVKIGIFLSIFNVHINRSPVKAKVIELRYHPGQFRNALRPDSAEFNENMWIALEEDDPPYRRMIVRQISGAIARRIVCVLRPGEVVERGYKIGMIKFGSRTELILADRDGLQIDVRLGASVRAGTTVVARYPIGSEDATSQESLVVDQRAAEPEGRIVG